MMANKNKQTMVVLTKTDRLKPLELHDVVTTTMRKMREQPKETMWPFVHAISATKRLGMDEFCASLSMVASDFERRRAQAKAARYAS